MDQFPFPDKIKSRRELVRDCLYNRIDPGLRDRISDAAWDMGVRAMEEIAVSYHNFDIYDLCREKGLKIKHESQDQVVGGMRYFSEYYSGMQEIILYDGSVKLWAAANCLSKELAEEIILSHEMFHSLECTEIGSVSNLCQVARFKIGKWKAGRCGICALSEIGAYGFSRAYYHHKALKEGG